MRPREIAIGVAFGLDGAVIMRSPVRIRDRATRCQLDDAVVIVGGLVRAQERADWGSAAQHTAMNACQSARAAGVLS